MDINTNIQKPGGRSFRRGGEALAHAPVKCLYSFKTKGEQWIYWVQNVANIDTWEKRIRDVNNIWNAMV